MSRQGSVIDQIKDKVSMVDVAARSLQLKQNGRGYLGLCPFHQDSKPSLKVYDDHYHCFSCGAHGDIVEWTQRTEALTFHDALRDLAALAGVSLEHDPEAEKQRVEHAARTALYRRAAEHYCSLLSDEARQYLHQRGFTDEFIATYLIGYAPGHGALNALAPKPDLTAAGLVNDAGRDALWRRITFPVYGRYQDEIVGLAGRAWPDPDQHPKFMPAPADPGPLACLYNLRGERGRRPDGTRVIWLVEGDVDTATAEQLGLPVVGVRGSQRFTPDLAGLFERVDVVYCAADPDPAGVLMTRAVGDLLGNKVRVVCFPDELDLNQYHAAGRDVAALAGQAPAYLEWLMDRLPREAAPEDIDRLVRETVPALLSSGPAAREVYGKRLARKLGITVAPVREQIREALAGKEASNGHAGHDGRGTGIVWDDKPQVNPSQALLDDVMHTVVFLDRIEHDPETGAATVSAHPHVVTSRREYFALTPEAMFDRGLRYSPSKVPFYSIVGRRWSAGADRPYSSKNYLDGGVQVAPLEVLSEVTRYFRRFVYYPNDLFHDFLALWTIGTYWFELFSSYPYCHLNGTKRAGKSRTLEVISALAFNAYFSDSMTPAATFRTIESCSATLLLDEAENLKKRQGSKDEGQDEDRLAILRGGYKRGAVAVRCTGENNEPTGFQLYSPKMFGSIEAIDRVLSDRVIALTLARKPEEVALDDFSLGDQEPALHATRDKLYCLMLDHAREVKDRLGVGIRWSGVRDRDRELWAPILTLAAFFDDHRLAEEGEQSLDLDRSLTARMRQLATQTVNERMARDRLEQTEIQVIEGALEFIHDAKPVEGAFFQAAHLLDYLRDHVDGLYWLKSARQIYAELEKVAALTKSVDLAVKPVMGDTGRKRQVRCVRLDRERLEQAAHRLGALVPGS